MVGQNEAGVATVWMVLEPGNLHRLKLGQPISLRLEDLFPDGIPPRLELRILHSETPVADFRGLSPLAGVAIDERGAVDPKRPHCPECRSTVEQIGVSRNDSPLMMVFCPSCGCVFGAVPKEAVKL